MKVYGQRDKDNEAEQHRQRKRDSEEPRQQRRPREGGYEEGNPGDYQAKQARRRQVLMVI